MKKKHVPPTLQAHEVEPPQLTPPCAQVTQSCWLLYQESCTRRESETTGPGGRLREREERESFTTTLERKKEREPEREREREREREGERERERPSPPGEKEKERARERDLHHNHGERERERACYKLRDMYFEMLRDSKLANFTCFVSGMC